MRTERIRNIADLGAFDARIFLCMGHLSQVTAQHIAERRPPGCT
jgi:hypothetical protein